MNKNGFSLIELLVAIALVGIMAAIVAPNFTRRGPKEKREQFIQNLNMLNAFAWKRAITTNKVQKIEFDFSPQKKIITVFESTGKKDQEEKKIFRAVKEDYRSTTLKIPSSFIFKNFYIEGVDEFAQYGAGKSVTGAWFFIVPEGLSQSVVINFIDTKERGVAGRSKTIGLVLNSFSARFKAYDTFKKP